MNPRLLLGLTLFVLAAFCSYLQFSRSPPGSEARQANTDKNPATVLPNSSGSEATAGGPMVDFGISGRSDASATVTLQQLAPGESAIEYLAFPDLTARALARPPPEANPTETARAVVAPRAPSLSDSIQRPIRSGGGGSVSPAGLNGRVTQAEVDALESGLDQTLAAIENNLVAEVFAENYPLVGKNFRAAWSNDVAAFRYLTTLRTAVVGGLSNLTGSVDYSTGSVASAINTRLTSAGFNAGSAVVVSTPGDFARLAFTTTDTFATNVPIAADFGLTNLDLHSLGATNCRVGVTATFNFTAGVDGSGFYFETAATFTFNTTSTISNLSTAVRFARLPFTLTDVTNNRTTVPLNFAIALKDPGNDGGRVRLGELGGSPDLLDATVTGNTRLSGALRSSVPAIALMPQVGTDLELLWNFAGAPVNPNDNNATFGSQPSLTLKKNRIYLGSFVNVFADRALRQIDETTGPLQPVIDALTLEIPLLSDLGSADVTILDLFDVPEEAVAAIGGLAKILNLANASTFTGGLNAFADLGDFTLAGGDLRVQTLDEIPGAVSRIPGTYPPGLNDGWEDFLALANEISGLDFPIL
ncbi:MAG: hypothetical protein EXS35_02275 [Pedosphaera sp.]|nr:hypothetical protein [Pedosphaera sp.]